MSKLKIEITSPPDRDNLVAEIWFGDSHVGEINTDNGTFEIEIYKQPFEMKYWTFKLEEFIEVLQEAKTRLATL